MLIKDCDICLLTKEEQLREEYWEHPKIVNRIGYMEYMSSFEYIGHIILTYKYDMKCLSRVQKMLNRVNRDVSINFYGQQAFKKYPEVNKIKWVAVVETNRFNDGFHIHLLLIKSDQTYCRIKPTLSCVARCIKELWISNGGGIKSGHKYIEDIEHLDNLIPYLHKQFRWDADRILYDNA